MRSVSDKVCRENRNTYYVFNNFFWKSCRLWDNVEKYVAAIQTTNDDVIRCIKDAITTSQITKAKLHIWAHNVQYLLIHNWFITSDLVNCLKETLKKREITQRIICHPDLFSNTSRLKRPLVKAHSFDFNSARALRMKSYIIFIVAGYMNLP